MSKYVVGGIVWYNFLNGQSCSIYNDYPSNVLRNKMIVSCIPKCLASLQGYREYEFQKCNRLFCVFENYMEYVKYLFKLPYDKHCFFEVLPPFPQKPHFDVEIEPGYSTGLDDSNVPSIMADGIKKILGNKGVDINIEKDIIICSSHGQSE